MNKLIFILLLNIWILAGGSNLLAQKKIDALANARAAMDTSYYDAKKILRIALEDETLSDSLKAIMTFELATCERTLGYTEDARILFDNAFTIAREKKMSAQLGDFYLRYGTMLPGIVGENTESFDLFHHAASIAREINKPELLFRSKIAVAALFLRYDEFNTAKKYLEEAEQVADDLSSLGEAEVTAIKCSLNLEYFNLFYKMKMLNSAFHFARKSLESRDNCTNHHLQSRAYISLGELAIAENQHETAINYYHQALEQIKSTKKFSEISGIYTKLAFVFNLQEDYDSSYNYNQKALRLRKKLGNKELYGSSLSNLGATLIKMERYDEAEYYLLEGLNIARQLKNSSFTEYALTKLVSLFKSKGDYKSALEFSQTYNNVRDSLHHNQAIAGLVKSAAAESLFEKEEEIEKLNEINSRTREQFTIGVVIFFLISLTGFTSYLSYKNRRIAEENRLAREEIQKADQLKSQFLAQMSHEIRTPLNSISNFSTILSEQLYENEFDEVKETVRIIDSEITRIIRTMGLLLDMAQLESENYTPIFKSINLVTDVIEKVLPEYSKLMTEKKLELLFANNISEPVIRGDLYSIDQIFRNIFDNAIKFTSEGTIELLLNRDIGNIIELKIVDSGIGMSHEYMKKLYEPFTQEEQGYTRTFEGNGIGLALVKRFCRLNGIDIFIESEKFEGTTVTLRFKSV